MTQSGHSWRWPWSGGVALLMPFLGSEISEIGHGRKMKARRAANTRFAFPLRGELYEWSYSEPSLECLGMNTRMGYGVVN
jgi:hypothetical protein